MEEVRGSEREERGGETEEGEGGERIEKRKTMRRG